MRDWKSGTRLIATLATVASLCGCISTSYRDSVGTFGTLTKAAVAAQTVRLDALAAAETERVHNDLAVRRIDLRWTRECAELLKAEVPVVDPTASAPAIPAVPTGCRLIAVGGKPIEAVSYDHIRALGAALASYSDNLILLTADSTADRKTFATSVTGLATALGGLDGAIRKATGKPAASSTATLDGIGTLVGKAGGLLLAAERAHALKRIVRRADPMVQEAVAILTDVDNQLGVYDMANRAHDLVEARNAASAVVNAPASSTAQVRAAQDDVFAKFHAYAAGAAEQQHYAAIGAAHAKLAAAARDGATVAELKDAIEAVLDLASTTSDLIRKPTSADAGAQ